MKRAVGRILYALFLVMATGLMLEAGLRIWFASQIGPRVLAYGTSAYRNDSLGARTEDLRRDFLDRRDRDHSVFAHENERAGYSKFFPGERKVTYDVDTGEVFSVHINAQGFRGRDFAAEKPPGVLRVVSLGSSSTFGYYNGDDTTYPHLLEGILNQGCAERMGLAKSAADTAPRYEVMNLGVPHLTSGEIVALFRAEALALDPDVVTFYEGRNDSAAIGIGGAVGRLAQATPAEQFAEALRSRLLLVHFASHLRQSGRLHAVRELPESVVAPLERDYLEHVAAIEASCRERDILFVVANQQASSQPGFGLPEAERLHLKGVRLAEEVALIRAKMTRNELVATDELSLVIHDRLQTALGRWARERRVPFVDSIERLDEDRHLLLSWVHLHPEANRALAGALAETILDRTCTPSD